MQRIKLSQIEGSILTLNEAKKQTTKTYVNGKSQIGNYHTYQAYGSIGVNQIVNESGGVKTIIPLGTKREIYNQLRVVLQFV